MVARKRPNVTLYVHCLSCLCVSVNRDVVINENCRVCCGGCDRSSIYDGKIFSEILHKTYTSKIFTIINNRKIRKSKVLCEVYPSTNLCGTINNLNVKWSVVETIYSYIYVRDNSPVTNYKDSTSIRRQQTRGSRQDKARAGNGRKTKGN